MPSNTTSQSQNKGSEKQQKNQQQEQQNRTYEDSWFSNDTLMDCNGKENGAFHAKNGNINRHSNGAPNLSVKRSSDAASLTTISVPSKVVKRAEPKSSTSFSLPMVLCKKLPTVPDGPHPTVNKKKIRFKSQQMIDEFMPVLQKLYYSEEGLAFRTPVDPVAMNLPNYYTIVKHPMDLTTIRRKLLDKKYADPYEIMEDVWQMFDNAWSFNKKQSKVYRDCKKLCEMFQFAVDPIIRKFGYCCSRSYKFHPTPFCCMGANSSVSCLIQKDAKYFSYDNKYFYCAKCFNATKGDWITVEVDDEGEETKSLSIQKSAFEKKINLEREKEPIVECVDCGRKFHTICVLYVDYATLNKYKCNSCSGRNSYLDQVPSKQNKKFSAKNLPPTKLGESIESRVHNFMKQNAPSAGDVYIRVLSSYNKTFDVKPMMKERFVDNGSLSSSFPYKAKAIFAFQIIDGVEVCFFALHVQEYGPDCPPPNTRHVYIAYLDSVHFFQPREFRTDVYQQIILGYMAYVKGNGFTTAHIWSSPPAQGDDYIFYCHPYEQKIPKQKRLQDWYKNLLELGIEQQIVVEYSVISPELYPTAIDLPQFEGDFWPNFLEHTIANMNDQKKPGTALAEKNNNLIKQRSLSDDKKKRKSNGRRNSYAEPGDHLSAKLHEAMERHKDDFFVVNLWTKNDPEFIQDPDPTLECELMDGRDGFLALARERKMEFCTLRLAKYSTLVLLTELHTVFLGTCSCDNCEKNVRIRLHCTVCEDYDLCIRCSEMVKHPHDMEKIGFELLEPEDELVSSSPALPALPKPALPTAALPKPALAVPTNKDNGTISLYEQRLHEAARAKKFIPKMLHACHCRDPLNCGVSNCAKWQRILAHALMCPNRFSATCEDCRALLRVTLEHIQECTAPKIGVCQVPYCDYVKYRTLPDPKCQPRAITQNQQHNSIAAAAASTGPSQYRPVRGQYRTQLVLFRNGGPQGQTAARVRQPAQQQQPMATSTPLSQFNHNHPQFYSPPPSQLTQLRVRMPTPTPTQLPDPRIKLDAQQQIQLALSSKSGLEQHVNCQLLLEDVATTSKPGCHARAIKMVETFKANPKLTLQYLTEIAKPNLVFKK